jgi:hypothetical protein
MREQVVATSISVSMIRIRQQIHQSSNQNLQSWTDWLLAVMDTGSATTLSRQCRNKTITVPHGKRHGLSMANQNSRNSVDALWPTRTELHFCG